MLSGDTVGVFFFHAIPVKNIRAHIPGEKSAKKYDFAILSVKTG
jgi:hypothetical protein